MRKSTLTLLALLAIILMAAAASAQGFGTGDGVCNFIDEDGDGFNDLAPDADGDGIPNGMDPDYVPLQDGSGAQHQYGKLSQIDGLAKGFGASGTNGRGNMGIGGGSGYGLQDGTGSGMGPADGTGFGPGTGDCDTSGDTIKGTTLGHRGGRR